MLSETRKKNRQMVWQKAEELYKDAGAHPRQQFSVAKWVGKWFKSIQKLVIFWKQSEDFKDSFRTETSTIAHVPV